MSLTPHNWQWGTFGGSPAVFVDTMAQTLQSTWSQVYAAYKTLSSEPSNTGFQLEYQFYSNVNNMTLQLTSTAVAAAYDISKKILENTRT